MNIGAAARAMSNFGISDLRLVNPYPVAFHEARSAVGASPILAAAEEYTNVAEAVADCTLVVGTTAVRHRELQHQLKPLPQAASHIRAQLSSGAVALLFGSEKVGLSNEDLSNCHWLVHIPTRQEHFSMNLGQAVAVCLYELIRDEKQDPAKSVECATAAELERITSSLMEALRESGYMKPAAESTAEMKVRRLVRRLTLQAEDAESLLGMLRQMLWKIRSKK